ncbi:MAG: hypothetical protein KDI01_10005 [Halioglobus sp.]|nr:hypothetical protein [Halioglobus sp.]
MSALQSSKLLGELFATVDEERRLTVLHIGPALSDTVAFFSHYRCKLHFVDILGELPIVADETSGDTAPLFFSHQMAFPVATRFDICLFWDLFNYLQREEITAFIDTLRPFLHPRTQAHGFALHNTRTPQRDTLYGISTSDTLSLRPRDPGLPCYAPHPQSRLKSLLSCFHFDRSVLLTDSRLEILLSARV